MPFPTVFDKYCPGSIANNVLSNEPVCCLMMKLHPVGSKYVWDVMRRHSESGGETCQ